MRHGIQAAAVLLLALTLAGSAFAQSVGAGLYQAKCASCHGADGLAATPMGKSMKVLSFKDPKMLSASDARFVLTTMNGENKMPAYKGKLTDEQIKQVVAFIRTLQK
jgi:mono/diheme cytochrome c family protein